MNESSAKAIVVAVALVTTWTSAVAHQGQFELTPDGEITDFRTVSVNLNQESSTVQELAVGPNVGAISANTTIFTATPALAPSASSPDDPYGPTAWVFSLGLATDGGLVVISSVTPRFHPATQTLANLLERNLEAFRDFVRSADTAQITALVEANVYNGGSEGMKSNDITQISFNRSNPNQNGSRIKFSRENSNIQVSGLQTTRPGARFDGRARPRLGRAASPTSSRTLTLGAGRHSPRRKCGFSPRGIAVTLFRSVF